jgi:CBS domain-containing protein
MQRIKDVMTPNPKTCQMDHSVMCALDIMRNVNCGAVPIVDDNNKVHGIITDRDIALCLVNHASKTPQDLKVKDCVKHVGNVITVKQDEDIHRAVTLMEQHQVRRIPVVDEEQHIIGIIAQADIALKDEQPEETAELVREISKERHETIGANP